MLLSLIAATVLQDGMPREMFDYLRKPDPSFVYSTRSLAPGRTEIRMTSQTWQDYKWRHTILYQLPTSVKHKGTAILYITGDGPFKGDLTTLNLISQTTQMPVAMLFGVPNQPLWGMKEDDLIAHTFEKYIETGDPNWPLLFPMVKSAIRAMDAVTKVTKGTSNPIDRFVVTGASKRGWTTWLVGASGDRRVRAIAPMVFDNLNVEAQMRHQISSWGKYSEMIEDYTRRGLQEKLYNTPEGKRLARMIDPYTYIERIKMPTLIVNGANDPYWTADALRLYWDELDQNKWVLNVPNAGHDLGDGLMAAETIGAYGRAISGEFEFPKQTWKIEEESPRGEKRILIIQARSQNPPFEKLAVWVNASDTLDFRSTKWTRAAVAAVVVKGGRIGKTTRTLRVEVPRDQNVAIFLEMRYRVNGRQFSLSTPIEILKK